MLNKTKTDTKRHETTRNDKTGSSVCYISKRDLAKFGRKPFGIITAMTDPQKIVSGQVDKWTSGHRFRAKMSNYLTKERHERREIFLLVKVLEYRVYGLGVVNILICFL